METIGTAVYYCPKHGIMDTEMLTFFTVEGATTRKICTRCYMDFIAEHVPEIERLDTAS